MNRAKPLAEPIPAALAGRADESSTRAIGSGASAWRLLLTVALPYWAAVSVVNIIASELFASGGARVFNARALGLTFEVRALQHLIMTIVVLGAYRAALSVGWPDERRWLAIAKHLALGLAVALISRPVFVLAMELQLDVRVFWRGVFLPPPRGVKLWASMGLEFLPPYFFGLALIAGVHISHALHRSELERANLRSAWMHARLQALRMQLNPHFLFNTFNTIATLLDANPQPARARTLVLALSDLYRRTLVAAEREWMPLEDELALANDYLRIQAARFEGRLSYEIVCSPDLRRERVPALLLQPLVENAATHGSADDRQSLRIWIRIERRDHTFGESALHVEFGNATDGALGASRGAGIGLRNTRTRLSTCYGGRAQMEARATQPGSFVAAISIPDAPSERAVADANRS